MTGKSTLGLLVWYTTQVSSLQPDSHCSFLCLGGKPECQLTTCLNGAGPQRTSHSEYVTKFQNKMKSSYNTVWHHWQQAFQHQKEHYDQKVHGNPYQEGDLVWMHSPGFYRDSLGSYIQR